MARASTRDTGRRCMTVTTKLRGGEWEGTEINGAGPVLHPESGGGRREKDGTEADGIRDPTHPRRHGRRRITPDARARRLRSFASK